jgi:hypothetical protein
LKTLRHDVGGKYSAPEFSQNLFDIWGGWAAPFAQRTNEIRKKWGVSMKRSVSLAASLVVVLGMLSACGAAADGKAQLATVCGEKAGASLNCSCFADALATNLPPEQFDKVAKAIDANRRYTGFIPANLADDMTVGATITAAQMTCPA